ncbi:hypothetical protein EV426DRAFT_428304 [Tirmania nivea]|nr:hypothetical protein EV426DRAFT_428304 [Tirmania nivea]
MWPHTHTSQSLYTHTQKHFQSLDHSQTGVDDSNTLIGGYNSFNQSSAQLEQYGGTFERMLTIEHSSARHETNSEGHVNDVNTGGTRINIIDEMIEEEHEDIQGGQAMEVVQWGSDPDARNSKSSQLPSRAHSRSPAPCSNLAGNQEARRVEGACQYLAEAPLASPPPSFAPPAGLTPTALNSTALSGSPHNNQHRPVGQYKGLNNQSKRRLKSSISLDSSRFSRPYSQNLHYYLPLRLSSSTITTTTPAVANISSFASTPTTRDQLASPNPSTRPAGVDKKDSSPSILDRLKSEDTMMAQSSQHMPHERMAAMEDISSHGQMLDKYRVDGSYGASLPLSPPPSATRPEFIGANSAPSSFHMPDDVGLSFSGSEIEMARPHSMSTLRDVSSFSEQTQDGGDIPRLDNQYQDMNQVGESSMFMRQSPQACWASPNWLAEIPQPLEIDMMESPPDQSPTAQQWVDENGNSEPSHLRLSTGNGLQIVMPGINQSQASFRLASPPLGRGIHRMPSCSSFCGPSLGYHMQQPPSPALEEHDIANFPQYMERSCSNSSSIPSPPESPDLYFPAAQMHTPTLGFPVTPLVNQDRFSSDIYAQMSDSQHNRVHSNSICTPRSSRTSSRSIPSQAAAAPAATKNPSKTSKSRSSRRVVSNSNGRNSSSRNRSASSSGSVSGRGLGLGCDGGEMPFVNFTPQDATRILSGVAPSGSSKTKARREREAMEKRRKLSEAAAAAVLAAGGDPSQLKEVELLTMT